MARMIPTRIYPTRPGIPNLLKRRDANFAATKITKSINRILTSSMFRRIFFPYKIKRESDFAVIRISKKTNDIIRILFEYRRKSISIK